MIWLKKFWKLDTLNSNTENRPLCSVIVPKQRDKTVATITVSACLDYCANRAYMDDISLIQEPVQTYDYDEKGNLVSATNSEGKSTTTMDDQDRMTGYTAITGVNYELHYSGNSRDPEWIKSDGITTSYTYDAAGNVTQTKTQAPNNGKYLQSNTEYDSTKNFVTKTTDTNGSVSQTSYNTATGVLDWSKNPKNLTTFYTYNTQNNRVASSYITNNAYLYYDYYSDGQLRQLNRKSFPNGTATWQAYNFAYDDWGNTTAIRVWKPSSDSDHSLSSYVTLASYTYNDTGKMTKMRYPSGQYVTYEYDNLDRLVKEVYHNSDESIQVEYQYIYSSDGQLAKQQAIRDGTVIESYSFEYDSLGRLIRSREDSGAASVQRTEHLYDTANRLTKQNWTVGDRNFTETYGYNTADGTMASMLITYDAPTASGGLWVARDKLTYSYDDLNRLTQVLDTENYSTQFYTRNYTYQDLGGSRTTSRLAQYDYRNPSDNDSIIYGNSYAYDANGNITQINEVYTVNGSDTSRVLAEYEYDGLNQLKKETRYTYVGTSATAASTTVVTYTIDTAGNIRSVTTKVDGTTMGTVSYTYGNNYWADKLTAISVNGTSRSISYGDYCNPSTWFNGTDYTGLTWTQGRRLSSITKGSDTYSYEYDMSGVRSVKIADGLRHEYVTQNGKVVRETVTNASTGAFQYMLDFTYDESGHPLTMRRYYNEAQTSYNTYHYVLNAQGDVIKLLHGSNTTVAEYSYDAWGNILSATGSLANINPLRYRGYYFDTETGFYYLQSRYYDPIVKRFINADSYASTGQSFLGYNMFAYCGNNPIVLGDASGHSCVCLDATDSGTGIRSPKGVQYNRVTPTEEDLFQTCYKNTYGHYYCSPCGSKSEIWLETVYEYTQLEKDVDTFLIFGGISLFGWAIDLGAVASFIVGGGSSVIGNYLLPDVDKDGTKIFTVIEWDWYNDPFGNSGYSGFGTKYQFEVDEENMTLILTGRWHIIPNPDPCSGNNCANGKRWW